MVHSFPQREDHRQCTGNRQPQPIETFSKRVSRIAYIHRRTPRRRTQWRCALVTSRIVKAGLLALTCRALCLPGVSQWRGKSAGNYSCGGSCGIVSAGSRTHRDSLLIPLGWYPQGAFRARIIALLALAVNSCHRVPIQQIVVPERQEASWLRP